MIITFIFWLILSMLTCYAIKYLPIKQYDNINKRNLKIIYIALVVFMVST